MIWWCNAVSMAEFADRGLLTLTLRRIEALTLLSESNSQLVFGYTFSNAF